MKALKTFLLTVIFVTVFGINSVYAAIEIEAPPTSGSGDWASECNGNGYCYNSMGLRFTLYEYVNPTTAQKVGYSHDFWRYDTQCNNRTSSACTSDYEKRPWDYGYVGNNHSKPQSFSDPMTSDVIRDKKNGTKPGASKFSLNVDGYKNGRQNYYTVVDQNIWSCWLDPVNRGDLINENFREWLANTTSNKLINKFDSYDEIKNIYHLSDAQIQDVKTNPNNYFFTAEMLGSISTNNASSRPSGFNKNKNYVGTVFELNQFYNHTGIFKRYAKALYLYYSVHMDGKTIVGPSNNSRSYILKTSGDTINQANIWSNRAIGMTVFKLTDIIKSCRDTCSGTGVNTGARLKCAENYCENDPSSTDSSKKKACIVACGYSDPGGSTCSANTCTNTNSANCQTTNKITSRTCSSSNYYKTECTEYLTLNYSSGLPKVFINSLGGFNYFVDTNGTKSCTLIFNTRKYEFEYAALKRSDRISSSAPIRALDYFQTLATNTTDEKYTCKWDDSDTIQMTVNDDDTNTKSLHKKIDNNSGTTVEASTNGPVHNYSGSSTTTLTKKVEATFKSTNTSSWELPQMCYHLKDNTQEVVWNSTTNDLTCGNDGKAATFYYGYYIKKVTEADGNLKPKVPVNVKVTKESLENDSCINENKCYYLNETDDKTKTAECNISFEKTGDRTYKVKYNVTNRSDLAGVSCKFDGSIVNCNNPQQKEITINPNNTMKVDGSVTYTTASGNNVTVSCPVIIRNKETPVGSKTCKGPGPDSYKPANYAGIKKYCREHWDTDTAGYGSYDSCVSDCSNQDEELCENKYKPYQTTQIKDWCHNHYKTSGYKSEDSCINTCTTTKIGEGYTYRPIALGESGDSTFKFNAFPKRDAGTNWKGYEQKYTVDDNDYNEQPIYVINLSADNIKRIKQDTKNSGENVYADFNGEYETDGSFFRSEYVNNNTSIFTRVNEYYWKEAD